MFEKQYFGGFDFKNPAHKKLYLRWHDMIRRCTQPQNKSYPRYGGRGISVCHDWMESFQSFYDWAMTSGYSPELSIDRKDVNGDYTPDNCRWATEKEQQNNKRSNRYITFNGQIKTMAEWSDETGVSYYVLRSRLRRGWTEEESLTAPLGYKRVMK